jgi:predicted TIM-barrel fold metal-dependent hydrolase
VHPFVQGFLANDEIVFPLLDLASRLLIPVYVHTGAPGNATPWHLVDCAERFPDLDIIVGHCGATDFWYDVAEAAWAAPSLYLEASLARPFIFSRYVEAIGDDRCVMGSAAPLNPLQFEWSEMRALLPPSEHGGIYGESLLRLLQKKGALP